METEKRDFRIVNKCVDAYQVGIFRENYEGEKVFIVDASFFYKGDALEFVKNNSHINYIVLDYYGDCFIK